METPSFSNRKTSRRPRGPSLFVDHGLDSAVALAARLVVVARYGPALTGAAGGEAVRRDGLPLSQPALDRFRPALREPLVVSVVPLGVGVTLELHPAARIGANHRGELRQGLGCVA